VPCARTCEALSRSERERAGSYFFGVTIFRPTAAAAPLAARGVAPDASAAGSGSSFAFRSQHARMYSTVSATSV
jgi:hypothetical protein